MGRLLYTFNDNTYFDKLIDLYEGRMKSSYDDIFAVDDFLKKDSSTATPLEEVSRPQGRQC